MNFNEMTTQELKAIAKNIVTTLHHAPTMNDDQRATLENSWKEINEVIKEKELSQ